MLKRATAIILIAVNEPNYGTSPNVSSGLQKIATTHLPSGVGSLPDRAHLMVLVNTMSSVGLPLEGGISLLIVF